MTCHRKNPLQWPPTRWIAVLLVCHVFWRTIRWLLVFPMWGDEAFIAVNFISLGYMDMFGTLVHDQVVPLGYLWTTLALSQVLGTSELVLRIPAVAAGIATALLFAWCCVRWLGRHQAMLAIAIFCASYYSVRYATEVKPYSLDMLIALIITVLAWRVHVDINNPRRWIALAITLIIGAWFSYPVVFPAGGALLFLAGRVLWQERTRDDDVRARSSSWVAPLIMGIITSLLFAGSFLAMWFLFGKQQSLANDSNRELEGWLNAFPPITEPLGMIRWFFNTHTGNMMAYPIGGNHGGSSLTTLFVVFGIWTLWREKRALLLLLLSPLPFMFLAAAMEAYPYGDSARVLQHMGPAICLLAGVGILAVMRRLFGPRGPVHAGRIVCVMMLVLIFIAIVVDLKKPYKTKSDLHARETAQWLTDHSEPGQAWIVHGGWDDQAVGPNLRKLGGDFARLRYQMLQQGDRPFQMNVPANAVPPASWVMIYRDPQRPFDPQMAEQYIADITARLGQPVVHEFDFEREPETVWLYEFSANQTSAQPMPE